MAITTQIGFRHYEFGSQNDFMKARKIWATPCTQDEFEDKLEAEGVDFHYDLLVSDDVFYGEI